MHYFYVPNKYTNKMEMLKEKNNDAHSKLQFVVNEIFEVIHGIRVPYIF